MIVLKIIGWILLSVLALIILALCVKVKIIAEYSDDNTSVILQWLFLKIPLYPSEKKPKKEEEAQKEEQEEEEEEEKKEEKPKKPKESFLHMLYRTHGIDGILLLLKKLFSYIGSFFGDLLKSVVVEEFYLDVCCTKGDAASTAIYYGEVCSAIFPLLGALVSKYKVRKYDINVYPDFIARFGSASFNIKLHLYPIYLIGITLLLVFRLVFKVVLGMFVKIFLAKKDKSAEK